MSKALPKPVLSVIEVLALALTPSVLLVCTFFDSEYTQIISFAAVITCCVVMVLCWELSSPSLDTLLLSVVLGVIAALTRVLSNVVFAAIPNVQPVTAICVISGCILGPRASFMTGCLSAIVSNCFLGQGLWTPWQMYSWGLVGYVAGCLFFNRDPKSWVVIVYGAASSFVFGFIMNSWTLLSFVDPITFQSAIAVYAAGLSVDAIHCASSVVFLLLLYAPWKKRLERIKTKYMEL